MQYINMLDAKTLRMTVIYLYITYCNVTMDSVHNEISDDILQEFDVTSAFS